MQIVRECRVRAVILTELAKEAPPELEIPLLYVAQKWLTLAILVEQSNVDTDRTAQRLSARH
jgi:hypothetical protein